MKIKLLIIIFCLFIFAIFAFFFLIFKKGSKISQILQTQESLVAWWDFEEKGQYAFEKKRRILNFRLGKSPFKDPSDPKRVKGKFGKALKFDGKDDYLILQDHPELRISKEITIEGWFKVENLSFPPLPLWLEDFSFRKKILIDNTQNEKAFQDQQILIKLDTKTLIEKNKMEPDCKDISFTDYDQTTEIPFWLQSHCNTKETKIWVRVPSLAPFSKKTIFFYYGKKGAQSKSNFYQTMQIPPTKWWDFPKKEEVFKGKEIRALAVDKDDNIFVVGSEKSQNNFRWYYEIIDPRGFLIDAKKEDISRGDDEINDIVFDLDGRLILAGYDFSEGNSQWRVTVDQEPIFVKNYSPGPDEAKAVWVDLENNIIIGGYDSSPGDPQWRVVKIDPQGKKIFDYSINPSSGADVVVDVKVDSKNNIIVAGYEKSLGHDRWRIEKLDPKGKLIWGYIIDLSSGADVINAIALDSKDNIIAVGYDFYFGDAQWRIIKLNPQGKRIWDWSFNPSLGFDELRAVFVDSEDNFIVGGHDAKNGEFAWDILKFSSQGEKLWEWQYNPSPKFDELKDLILDSKGNIIVAGYDFAKDFNPHWRVTKFSEKKPIFPEPKILVLKEEKKEAPLKNIIISKKGSYQVSAHQSRIFAQIGKNSISAPIKTLSWHHFALVYDGKNLKLYLDGKLSNTQALAGEIPTNFNNLLLGYNFRGIIDEIKIFKRALSLDEILNLYYFKK